jgi:hypothetical protein
LYCPSQTSLRVRHILSRQLYGRKLVSVQRDLQCGDFGSRRLLKIEHSKVLMMLEIYITI